MEQMRHRVMALNLFSSIDIDRDSYRFAGLGSATIGDRRAMNKNIAALLSVDDPKLPDFGPIVTRNMQHAVIANLSAHFGIERRSIEHNRSEEHTSELQ